MDSGSINEIGQIKKYFGLLFDRGYSICYIEPANHFNNWLVRLKSDKFYVQFCEDRFELIIQMGPNSATTGWSGKPPFDMSWLVFYLTDGKSLPGWRTSDEDFKNAANTFGAYQSKFEDILSEDNFPKHLRKLQNAKKSLTAVLMNQV